MRGRFLYVHVIHLYSSFSWLTAAGSNNCHNRLNIKQAGPFSWQLGAGGEGISLHDFDLLMAVDTF